jgi:hypothetical protein
MHCSGSGYGQESECCEHRTEPLRSIICGELFRSTDETCYAPFLIFNSRNHERPQPPIKYKTCVIYICYARDVERS